MKYNFCKIYISTEDDIKTISLKLNSILHSYLSDIEFYVDENEEYNKKMQLEFPDGFLYFKYIIEIEFSSHFSKGKCIEAINKILLDFWNSNIPSIAVYDLEDELVKKGGFNSEEIPWPQ